MPDATPEEVIAMRWLHPHYATPDGQQRMNFQAFVVRAPGRVIMIDCCTGNGREREYDIFTNLQTSFLEDIKAVPGISGALAQKIHDHFRGGR